jgi:hypothetical protein
MIAMQQTTTIASTAWLLMCIFQKHSMELKKNIFFKMQIILFRSRLGHHRFLRRSGILYGEQCTI